METETDSRIVRINPEMVEAYREATGDTNAIHNSHALGFQLELILKGLYHSRIPSELNHIKTKFRKLVPISSNLEAKFQKIGECFVIQGMVEGELALETRINEKERSFKLSRNCVVVNYALTEHDATLAGKGLGKTSADYLSLAIGLSSKALIDFSHKEPVPEGKIAVYTSHDLFFEDLNVREGRIVLRAEKKRRIIYVEAEQQGKRIYAAKLGIVYADIKNIE